MRPDWQATASCGSERGRPVPNGQAPPGHPTRSLSRSVHQDHLAVAAGRFLALVLLACALVCGNRLWSPSHPGGLAVAVGSYNH